MATFNSLDISNIVSSSIFKQFEEALKTRHNNIIVISGPSGSLKTSLIHTVLNKLSLVSEYITDVSVYKSKLLTKSSICLTDIDDLEYFIKHKHKINKMSNLIIETRLLPYMYKSLDNGIGINLSISNKNKKDKINYHLSPYKKLRSIEPLPCIYKTLNILFSNQSYKVTICYDYKILKYIFSNSLEFIELESLYNIYDSISLADLKLDEFIDYAVYAVAVSKKRKIRKFVCLKSWVYENHYVCTPLCFEYKKYF